MNRWLDRTPPLQRKAAVVLMMLSLLAALVIEYGGLEVSSPLWIVVGVLTLASLVVCFKLACRASLSSRFPSGVRFYKEDEYNFDRMLNILTIIACLSSALFAIITALKPVMGS
ncbi:hypothetical protein [Vibrio parahaemolyticus]|uniref:hypothetical protein n=1 Tax=Vibrio parahaemolyticus TaxID=670 RepID=UPI000813A562|nr:hypothetical protein [Vibrio parahaemolyticus]OCP68358.1 hypothetical protein AKH08_16210 [Vibrio parahaemolyticus]